MAGVNSLILSLAFVVPLAAAVEINFLVWCPYCRHCLSHSSPVCVRLHASGYVQLCSVCTCMSMCGYVLVDVYVCVRVLLGPLCIWKWWCVRWCDGGGIGDVRPGLGSALSWDSGHHQGEQREKTSERERERERERDREIGQGKDKEKGKVRERA